MPSTIIDSDIFGDIFSAEPMRKVWSDEYRTQKYLDVEAALAKYGIPVAHRAAAL